MWGMPWAVVLRQLVLIRAGLLRPEQVIPGAPPAIPAKRHPNKAPTAAPATMPRQGVRTPLSAAASARSSAKPGTSSTSSRANHNALPTGPIGLFWSWLSTVPILPRWRQHPDGLGLE
jgi:hypothetical protein